MKRCVDILDQPLDYDLYKFDFFSYLLDWKSA